MDINDLITFESLRAATKNKKNEEWTVEEVKTLGMLIDNWGRSLGLPPLPPAAVSHPYLSDADKLEKLL